MDRRSLFRFLAGTALAPIVGRAVEFGGPLGGGMTSARFDGLPITKFRGVPSPYAALANDLDRAFVLPRRDRA